MDHTTPQPEQPNTTGSSTQFNLSETTAKAKNALFGDPQAPNAATRRKAVIGGGIAALLLLVLATCAGGDPQKSPEALAETFAAAVEDSDTDLDFCKAIYPLSTDFAEDSEGGEDVDVDEECEENFDEDDRELLDEFSEVSFDGRLDIDADGDDAEANWGKGSNIELDMDRVDGKWLIDDFDVEDDSDE